MEDDDINKSTDLTENTDSHSACNRTSLNYDDSYLEPPGGFSLPILQDDVSEETHSKIDKVSPGCQSSEETAVAVIDEMKETNNNDVGEELEHPHVSTKERDSCSSSSTSSTLAYANPDICVDEPERSSSVEPPPLIIDEFAVDRIVTDTVTDNENTNNGTLQTLTNTQYVPKETESNTDTLLSNTIEIDEAKLSVQEVDKSTMESHTASRSNTTSNTFFETDDMIDMIDYESDSENDTLVVEVLMKESQVDCVTTITKTHESMSSTMIKCEDERNNVINSAAETATSNTPTVNNKTETKLPNNTVSVQLKDESCKSRVPQYTKSPASDQTDLTTQTKIPNTDIPASIVPNNVEANTIELTKAIELLVNNQTDVHSTNEPNSNSTLHASDLSSNVESNTSELNTSTQLVNNEAVVPCLDVISNTLKPDESDKTSRDMPVTSTSPCSERSERKTDNVFHDKSLSRHSLHSTEITKKPHIAVVFPLKECADEEPQTQVDKEKSFVDSGVNTLGKYVFPGNNWSVLSNSPEHMKASTSNAVEHDKDTLLSADDISFTDEMWSHLQFGNMDTIMESKPNQNTGLKSHDRNTPSFTKPNQNVTSSNPNPEKRRRHNDERFDCITEGNTLSGMLKNQVPSLPVSGFFHGQQISQTTNTSQCVNDQLRQPGYVNLDNSVRQQMINQFQLEAIRARERQRNISNNNIQTVGTALRGRADVYPGNRPPIENLATLGGNSLPQPHPPNPRAPTMQQPNSRSGFMQPTPRQQGFQRPNNYSMIQQQLLRGTCNQPAYAPPNHGQQIQQIRGLFPNQMTRQPFKGPQYPQARRNVIPDSQVNAPINRFGNSENAMRNLQQTFGDNQQAYMGRNTRFPTVTNNQIPVGQDAAFHFRNNQINSGQVPTLADYDSGQQTPFPDNPFGKGTSLDNSATGYGMEPGRPGPQQYAATAPEEPQYNVQQLLNIVRQTETLPELSWILNSNDL